MEQLHITNDWYSEHEVIFETEAYSLLKFSSGEGVPILIRGPSAGHSSQIADYAPEQSLCEAAKNNTNSSVYCMDIKAATTERKDESYDDLILQVLQCVDVIGSKVHLVGLCMGGTLATIYTALFPGTVETLTVAGSPIDVEAAPSDLDFARIVPIEAYKAIVAMSGGLMLGDIINSCWKSSNLQMHYVDRWKPENQNDPRAQRFRAWYESPCNIAGNWYLYLIENHFQKNKLPKGEFIALGKKVDLSNITCPLNLVTGNRDTISPEPHNNRLADFVSSTDVKKYSTDGGHIAVFMSRKGIAGAWTEIFKSM